MNYTQNYHLGLPLPAERYDVSIVNANNTVIDGQLKINADAITNHKNDHSNPHAVTAAQVGLGNVDNTSDANKPVSTPQSQYITNAVSNESTRATNAEGALSDRITAEVTRAQGAESTASEQINAEIARATDAESALSTQLTAEVTRAQGAEGDIRSYVDEKISSTYKAGGSVYFADLPALAATRLGYVYNIKDDFTTTANFIEGAGKDYPAETNVVIVEKDEESYEEATVESGDNPAEMGLYELDGTDYSLTEDTEPVSGKTYYELTTTPAYYYDVLAGFIDTSDFVTNTDYATSQVAGIVKPDGTTITVDANGVISSQGGGGDVSSEEVSDIVNILGAKNLNATPYYTCYRYGTTRTTKGITFTTHDDGSVEVSGTATGNVTYLFHYTYPDPTALVLSNGSYILTGCPEGASGETYVLYAASMQNGIWEDAAVDYGSGAVFALNGDDYAEEDVRLAVAFDVYSGVTIDPAITIYPMIRPANISDNTYVPYAKTNQELTKGMDHFVDYSIQSIVGTKNILASFAVSKTTNGVAFTVNGNGTITANGTATADISFLVGKFSYLDVGMEYMLYGCPEGGDASKYYLLARYSSMSSGVTHTLDKPDYGAGVKLTYTSKIDFGISIEIKQGFECENLLFSPAIIPKGIADTSYVYPTKSNRLLDVEVSSILNVLGAKNLLPQIKNAQSINGVTFTPTKEGIVANGSSTASGRFNLLSEPIVFDFDVQVVNFSEEHESYIRRNGYATQTEPLRNNHLTVSASTLIDEIGYIIQENRVYENDLLQLMICPRAVSNEIYVPYAKTNRQLTEELGKNLTPQTLAVGDTTLTFQDNSITTDSTIFPYTSKWGVVPTDITATTGQAVLTFAAQSEAISVYINVK